MRCDQTAAWQKLQQHAQAFKGFDLRQAFAADADRAAALSQSAPCVFADLSKNHVDAATEALLQELAQETGVAAHRDAMFSGAHINLSEDRAVMHWLLRQPVRVCLSRQGQSMQAGAYPGVVGGGCTRCHRPEWPNLLDADQCHSQ